MWTFASVATVLIFGRLYIRWKYSRLYWDDFFTGFALLSLVANLATLTVAFLLDSDTPRYWQVAMASDMTIWTTFYLVKAAFLALCWLVFNVSDTFRRAWWIITIYTFLTYWPLLLGALWQCGDPLKYADVETCSNYSSNSYQYDIVWGSVATALHVSSDCLILALPLVFIGRLHMSRAQKLSSAAVFALVVIDIIMGLLRNIIVACAPSSFSVDALFETALLLQAFEPGLALIVCALPAYSVLLPRSKTRRSRNEAVQNATAPTAPSDKMESSRNLLGDGLVTELHSVTELDRVAPFRSSPAECNDARPRAFKLGNSTLVQ